MTREPLAFHNGRFIPQSELTIRFHDAGFVFGATVTDFCRTYRHKLFRWSDHLARLRHDAAACFIPLPYSDEQLTAAAEQLVKENSKALAANDDLALITYATPGPLGYMVGTTENGPPTVAMHTFPIPKERYRRFFTEGIELVTVGILPVFDNPLDWVKHRSRIHWWMAGRVSGSNSVPVLIAEDDRSDTPLGAILTVRGGVIERPRMGTVLDSISLRVVSDLAADLGMSVSERSKVPSTTPDHPVTEVLLAGSAFGIAGVRQFLMFKGRQKYEWPGPVFQKLATAWSEMVGLDIVEQFTD